MACRKAWWLSGSEGVGFLFGILTLVSMFAAQLATRNAFLIYGNVIPIAVGFVLFPITIRRRGKNNPWFGFAALAGCWCLTVGIGMLFLGLRDQSVSGSKFVPHLARLSESTTCLLIYASDHDDRFPPAERWQDAVGFTPPEPPEYAFNALLGGVALSSIDVPEKAAMLFESSRVGRNPSDAMATWVWRDEQTNVVFVNGDSESYRPGDRFPTARENGFWSGRVLR